ncbi:MAG: hypothetical protein U0414_31550 [Polyangiaceae bacterium]
MTSTRCATQRSPSRDGSDRVLGPPRCRGRVRRLRLGTRERRGCRGVGVRICVDERERDRARAGGSSVEADPTTGPVRRGPGPGGTDALAPQPSVTSTAAAPSASASGSAAVAVGPPPTFDIKNDCPDALALFVGPKPKGAAGATVNVAGRTTQSEKRAADGTQTVWIVDGKGEGVASARITATSKRVVVGSNCRSIQAE